MEAISYRSDSLTLDLNIDPPPAGFREELPLHQVIELLNRGDLSKRLVDEFSLRGRTALDLSDDASGNADVNQTTPCLSEQGMKNLAHLLILPGVKLERLVLGSVATFQPILDVLPRACNLKVLDVCAMTSLDSGRSESCGLSSIHTTQLLDYLRALHRGSAFETLRVNANIGVEERKNLQAINRLRVAEGLSDVVKFVERQSEPMQIDVSRQPSSILVQHACMPNSLVECQYDELNTGKIGKSVALVHTVDLSFGMDQNPGRWLTLKGVENLAAALQQGYAKNLVLGRVETLDPITRLFGYYLPLTMDLSKARIYRNVDGVPTETRLSDDHAKALASQIYQGKKMPGGLRITSLCIDTSAMTEYNVRLLIAACGGTVALKLIGPVGDKIRRDRITWQLLDLLNNGDTRGFLDLQYSSGIKELDLRCGELSSIGAKILAAVLAVPYVELSRLSIGRVNDLGHVLKALPRSRCGELDLSGALLWVRTGETEGYYEDLSDKFVEPICGAIRPGTKTKLRLDWDIISEESRNKLRATGLSLAIF